MIRNSNNELLYLKYFYNSNMSISSLERSQKKLKHTNNIKDISQNKKYKKFIDRIPYNVHTEKFKTTIVLLIFASLNIFKKYKDGGLMFELIAKNNFEKFELYKSKFKPSYKEIIKFSKVAKQISLFLSKYPDLKDDSFENHISLFFPKFDGDLDADFALFQEKIISSTNNQFDTACELLLNSLICNILDSRKNLYYETEITNIIENTKSVYSKIRSKAILSFYHIESVFLLQNIDFFLLTYKMNSANDEKNKCIELINEFRDIYEKNLIESSQNLKNIGPGLSFLKNMYNKQENFIVIFNFLLYAREFIKPLGQDLKIKNEYLKSLIEKSLHQKSFLIITREIRMIYEEILNFLHALGTGVALNEVNFIELTTKFIKNVEIMMNNTYFIMIMYGYGNRNYHDIYGILANYFYKKLNHIK